MTWTFMIDRVPEYGDLDTFLVACRHSQDDYETVLICVWARNHFVGIGPDLECYDLEYRGFVPYAYMAWPDPPPVYTKEKEE